jgi:hypothetical protein
MELSGIGIGIDKMELTPCLDQAVGMLLTGSLRAEVTLHFGVNASAIYRYIA